MKQRSVVYSGKVEIVEYPAVPVHDSILAKPLYVYVGDLERSVVEGLLPITKPVIIGSTGVVKVVEVLEGPTQPTGKDYTVLPFGDKGCLGVDTNGLLTTHATLTHSYLDEELVQSTPYDSIKPLVKHAVELASACEEPVLIEGCGLLSVATGLGLRRMGVEPVFYCEEGGRKAGLFGFNVHRHFGNLGTRWRTIVLTSTSPSSKHTVLSDLEYHRVVISPLSFTTWIPLRVRRIGSVTVNVVWKTGNYKSEIVRDIMRELSKFVKVVSVQDIEKALGLIPARGFGLILALKS